MTIYRRKLSKLQNQKIGRIENQTHNGRAVVAFISPDGKTLMTVAQDDLFDADGNYFQNDIA